MTKVLTDSLSRWQLSEFLDSSGMKTIFVFPQVKTYVRSRWLPAYLLKLVSPHYLSLTEPYLTAKYSFCILMYFRTTADNAWKETKAKEQTIINVLFMRDPKIWATSLTSHLIFQPQIWSVEKHHYPHLAGGETTHGHNEKGVIAASCSNSNQCKGNARGFPSALAAFCTRFLLGQSSAQAPEPQENTYMDPWAPAPHSDLWHRVFASQPTALSPGPCSQYPGSGMPQVWLQTQ